MAADRNNLADTDKVESPDGHLLLISECTKASEGKGTDHCSIFVNDLKTGGKKQIYEWDRDVSWNGGVDVFWSPTSKAVILNNYISTNTGESVLFILEPRFEYVNLSDVILDAHPPKLQPGGEHAYPAATWIDANTIQMKLTGHHDAPPTNGFTYIYTYDLKGRSSRLMKHVERCDSKHDQC